MSIRGLLVSSALILLLPATSAEDQASCKMIWLLRKPCTGPVSALVNQVRIWGTNWCPDEQEKCKYELMEESATSLKVKHTSTWTNQTTLILFEFNPPASPYFCRLKASSTPENYTITFPNDYCLIYNLIDAIGLTEVSDSKEICNKNMCPSIQDATCKD